MSEKKFDYARLTDCSIRLSAYGRLFVIGRTVFGREIPCVAVGSGRPHTLLVAGHHAREHLSSEALFRAVLSLCESGEIGAVRGTLYVVLSANPDGAELCINGISSAPEDARELLLSVNGGRPAGPCAKGGMPFVRGDYFFGGEGISDKKLRGGGEDFSMFKANGRCVDLNCNFPAEFGGGAGNRFTPATQGYVGAFALSEPENVALVSLMERAGIDALATFHTKGEVIYWDFGQRGSVRRRDREIGKKLCEASGFRLASSKGSTGGLKDFAVKYFGIPAFTAELGPDEREHPLSYELADRIARQIREFPGILAAEAAGFKAGRML